jgi:hypothetical protein
MIKPSLCPLLDNVSPLRMFRELLDREKQLSQKAHYISNYVYQLDGEI